MPLPVGGGGEMVFWNKVLHADASRDESDVFIVDVRASEFLSAVSTLGAVDVTRVNVVGDKGFSCEYCRALVLADNSPRVTVFFPILSAFARVGRSPRGDANSQFT